MTAEETKAFGEALAERLLEVARMQARREWHLVMLKRLKASAEVATSEEAAGMARAVADLQFDLENEMNWRTR